MFIISIHFNNISKQDTTFYNNYKNILKKNNQYVNPQAIIATKCLIIRNITNQK